VAARVTQAPLEEGLPPRLYTPVPQRRKGLRRRRAPHQSTFREPAHHDHAEPQLVREWQDLQLDFPLQRVVGHLDGRDPPAPHHLRQLAEGARAVVGRADHADASLGPQLFQDGQVRAPGDEVVDLIEVDVTAEEAQRALDLGASLLGAAGLYLCRDESIGERAVRRTRS